MPPLYTHTKNIWLNFFSSIISGAINTPFSVMYGRPNNSKKCIGIQKTFMWKTSTKEMNKWDWKGIDKFYPESNSTNSSLF